MAMVPSAVVAAALIGLTAEGGVGANSSVSDRLRSRSVVEPGAQDVLRGRRRAAGHRLVHRDEPGKLSGKILGLTLTLTPGNAESTLLQLLNTLTPLVPVTMTAVTAQQPVVLGNAGTISRLAVRAS